MQDETIRQKSSTGTPLVAMLAHQGIVPGIKVDTGAKPLAGAARTARCPRPASIPS
jgi:fructose-bisphosphate aldolase class I